jgi:hypothetical protein
MTVLVTVYFWLVEFPCMGERGDYATLNWAYFFVLIFDHSVPIIVLTLDWTHNSIKIEWNRFPFYMAVGWFYIGFLMLATFVVQQEDSERTYASMKFYKNPWAANLALVGVMCL